MSTRSIVSKPDGDGWLGRYVHYDGYPSGVGQSLIEIVMRDGIETARRTIVDEHVYWSSINASEGMANPDLTTGQVVPTGAQRELRPHVTVVGYGDADLNSESADEDPDKPYWMLDPTSFDCDAEWHYILGDTALIVATVGWGDKAGTLTPFGVFSYTLEGYDGLAAAEKALNDADE
jgi:hypothetical protein